MIDQTFANATAAKLAACEAQLTQAATDHPKRLKDLTREHTRLKKLLDKSTLYLKLKKEMREHREMLAAANPDPDLKGLAQDELAALEKTFPAAERDLMLALLPPDPNESRDTIMEIRAGTGGDEAALFAGDLTRMYMRYAESLGWKVEFIDSSPSEAGGYKEIVFSIQGDHVYRNLQFEGGAHRVQRVPVTEAQGRIHTSTATVAVLPEADDVDEIDIKPEDLRVDVYRASGAGGQHVNKTDSAVRITHLPTGLAIASQEERSQHKNRAKAMRVLRSRLLDMTRRQNEAKMGDSRRSQIGSGDRSERIRTYNFPQNRLTDHRVNLTLYNLDKVMEGGLEPIIKTLYDHDMAARLKQIHMTPDNALK
jgi:peptide chain release factor 1